MTRKNYVKLAAILGAYRETIVDKAPDALLPFDALVSRVCVMCQDDNPYFQSAKFRDAVYK